MSTEKVNHPAHYGGADSPYEAIKVIEAWALGFALGNAVKYISRAGKKPGSDMLEDLRKARWYLDHEIRRLDGTATVKSTDAAPLGPLVLCSAHAPMDAPGFRGAVCCKVAGHSGDHEALGSEGLTLTWMD